MTKGPTRRTLLAAGTAFAALPRAARADQPIELGWDDLLPTGEEAVSLESLGGSGVVEHEQLSTGFEQAPAAGVTTEYDGKVIRLPGYVVPLDYAGTGVTAFLLVPYVGACVHVPPPPANQLVMVTSDTPYEVSGLFDPVWVEGLFGSAATATELADVGYSLAAQDIRPYRG
ncbi:DUF3299 domain-containing protein [Pseudoroseicyclus aestuarii]|uniref:DUF3299 domain-containing protein n=1 Tax=Pseudoroseicyclus aestuarii TaxID=1795041 RepID=A0A318SVP0_9RHOB|nr:DUF3299 domain-containing protein [Pseudoroseicyclus aestuarii]PYE84406.1 hypothetical protein DFP88_102205 [Pseudoroseicyclus aestuarii]